MTRDYHPAEKNDPYANDAIILNPHSYFLKLCIYTNKVNTLYHFLSKIDVLARFLWIWQGNPVLQRRDELPNPQKTPAV